MMQSRIEAETDERHKTDVPCESRPSPLSCSRDNYMCDGTRLPPVLVKRQSERRRWWVASQPIRIWKLGRAVRPAESPADAASRPPCAGQ